MAVVVAALYGALRFSSFAQPPVADAALPPGHPLPDLYQQRHARALEAKWNVAVDVQMIALPVDSAMVFIPDLQSGDGVKVNAAVEQLQDLLKKKQAILLGWPRAIGVDGQRCTTEAIIEKRYPTEFDPPTEAQTLSSGSAPQKPQGLVPKAFETRNVGITIEVEPNVLNDEGDMLLNLTSNRVALWKFDRFECGTTKEGHTVFVEQPQFTSSKTMTDLKLHNGQCALLGLHPLAAPENYLEIVIVRAVATKMR